MLCTRSWLAAIGLALALSFSFSTPGFGQATPAPVGGPDQVLPDNTTNGTTTNGNEAGTNRRRCVGIDCLRFGEKEELYWLCSTLAKKGVEVDDKALCTAIGEWKATQQ